MHRTVGQRGNISSSLSTCSWFSAKTWVTLALCDRRSDLVGRCILIERHYDGAEQLRRAHRRIQPRPVVAEQGDMRAALQASRRQRRGKRGGFFRQFAPGYGTPDAAALFADGRTFTPLPE